MKTAHQTHSIICVPIVRIPVAAGLYTHLCIEVAHAYRSTAHPDLALYEMKLHSASAIIRVDAKETAFQHV